MGTMDMWYMMEVIDASECLPSDVKLHIQQRFKYTEIRPKLSPDTTGICSGSSYIAFAALISVGASIEQSNRQRKVGTGGRGLCP